jgi:anhydro-N-acetylmuramic acid kinase
MSGQLLDSSESRLIVGLMAGNSLDGISAAVVRTAGTGATRVVDFVAYRLHPISAETRAALYALHYPNTFTANDLITAHLSFGEELARAATGVLDEAGIPARDASVIGVQGANLIHAVAGRDEDLQVTGHLEVGELAVVAERTGVVVIGDLRPSDIARGGEGAPLSSYVDHRLFAGIDDRVRAIQNIGGIANVTYLPSRCTLEEVQSFDCGPGNMMIDCLVAHYTRGQELYDRDGHRADRGRVHEGLLAELQTHPYLALTPPKTSRGPEEFGEPFVAQTLERAAQLGLEPDDVIATATQYSVECMSSHYERFFAVMPDEVVLTGGGAHNKSLVARLRARLPGSVVRFHDEFGIPVDAREATTWAILADETMHGVPGTSPNATGAEGPSILGKVVAPSSVAGRFGVVVNGRRG